MTFCLFFSNVSVSEITFNPSCFMTLSRTQALLNRLKKSRNICVKKKEKKTFLRLIIGQVKPRREFSSYNLNLIAEKENRWQRRVSRVFRGIFVLCVSSHWLVGEFLCHLLAFSDTCDAAKIKIR